MESGRSHRTRGAGLWRSLVVIPALVVAGLGLRIPPSTLARSALATIAPKGKVVASVPPSALVQNGRLTICSDIPYAPKEFYTTDGTLEGSDVDIGNEIAARLSLRPVWVNSVFDTIIEALQSGKCDIILSSMGISAKRSQQIAQIPYDTGGQTFLVNKGNPEHIGDVTKNPLLLCGLKVSVELGTVEQDELKVYDAPCAKAGKPAIVIVSAVKADTAVEQLLTHKAQVLFNDEAPNAYLILQQPNEFQLLGKSVFKGTEGIGVVKTNVALQKAVRLAYKSMERDGTVQRILTKWHMSGDTLPPGS
ncbi:MAG TPA: ABC transporter substrate-binding protein [Chloroflexota bacterium]|nr:ABC transporter substrate-binding protein [Chloroflexota bacterium]